MMHTTRQTLCLALMCAGGAALAEPTACEPHKSSWSENGGWMNWHDAGSPSGAAAITIHLEYLSGSIWCENLGWISVGDGAPANGTVYTNASGTDYGVNIDAGTGNLSGLAWGENIGWINFSAGAPLGAAARLDYQQSRLRGKVWGENIGWISLDDAVSYVGFTGVCGRSDFDGDGDTGTDADLEAFFACLGGNCCGTCGSADFNGDGDTGTDADIEAFFRVLAGGAC